MSRPVVYTLSHCPVCLALKKDLENQGIIFEERIIDQDPTVKEEALKYGETVPVVVYENGEIQVGYNKKIG